MDNCNVPVAIGTLFIFCWLSLRIRDEEKTLWSEKKFTFDFSSLLVNVGHMFYNFGLWKANLTAFSKDTNRHEVTVYCVSGQVEVRAVVGWNDPLKR